MKLGNFLSNIRKSRKISFAFLKKNAGLSILLFLKPSLLFKPTDESTGTTIRICHRNSIGPCLFGGWKCKPGFYPSRAFPCDTPCLNHNRSTRGFGQFGGKTLLETLTIYRHSTGYIVSECKSRADTGDTARICG
jgi:hypothetical protein